METQNGSTDTARVRHLPYEVDPASNRFHYYENLWKKVGLEVLRQHYNPAGKTLLDYGCGRGEALQIYGAAGMIPAGTDTDPECVRRAGEFGKAEILRPEDPLAQFGLKSFDVVTCFHVLEHVPSPAETLKQLSRIARDYVVVAVPNLRNLRGITDRNFDLRFVNEGHLQGWDHMHFRNLAERHCQLELVQWGTDACILPLVSELVKRVLGERAAIACETGIFKRIFPYHCLSVLGLFRPTV